MKLLELALFSCIFKNLNVSNNIVIFLFNRDTETVRLKSELNTLMIKSGGIFSWRALHTSVESYQKQLSIVWNLGFVSGRIGSLFAAYLGNSDMWNKGLIEISLVNFIFCHPIGCSGTNCGKWKRNNIIQKR